MTDWMPENQLAHIRSLCRIDGETGCWIPTDGEPDGNGILRIEVAGIEDEAHRLAMRCVQPYIGQSYPFAPWVVSQFPLCIWAHKTGLHRARCLNPEHLALLSHFEVSGFHGIASAALIREMHGASRSDLIAVMQEHGDRINRLRADAEARLNDGNGDGDGDHEGEAQGSFSHSLSPSLGEGGG